MCDVCKNPKDVQLQLEHLAQGIMSSSAQKKRPGKTAISKGPFGVADGDLYGGGKFGADR